MNPADNFVEQSKNRLPDTVRIDTPDIAYCEPLRQFLQQRGCTVRINPEHTENVTYGLVVGNSRFVKGIVDKQKIFYEKRLIICWGQEPDITPDNITKLVLVDEITLSARIVFEIITFFITARRHKLDLRVQKQIIEKPKEKVTETKVNVPEQTKQRESIPETSDVLRIAQTISNIFSLPVSIKKEKPKSKIHFPHTHINKLQRLSLFLIILFSLLITPIVYYEGSIALSGFHLYRAYKCTKLSNIPCASSHSISAFNLLTNAKSLLSVSGPIASAFGKSDLIRNQEKMLTFLLLTHDLINNAEVLTKIGIDANSTLLQSDTSSLASPSILVLTEQMKTQLFSMQTTVNLLSAMLEEESINSTFPFTLPQVKQKLKSLKSMLVNTKEMLTAIDRFTILYPRLGGFRDKQTYLVLLQNSNELRPTGGFIGSFMRLTIADGIIEEAKIEDVYTIDGQLKGHVDPPEPIKTLLGAEHWYLRDSNWNPDFLQSAQKALWFYEKETGEQPDGVVAITTETISKLLAITGPIDIPDLNERITSDNFFAKSLSYTQGDFFPGSTQKKDFLKAFYTSLLDKITHTPSLSVYQMLEVIYESLSSRDIQLYAVKPETQMVLEQYGWAGRIPARNVFDFAAINEANASVSKVNYFIKHAESREITIGPAGDITKTISRTITNTSNGELGTGTYRNYLRLLIPKAAQLTEVTIDGIPVPARNLKEKILNLPYAEMNEPMESLQVIGVALDVSVGETRTLRATYTIKGLSFNADNNLVYEFYDQKQAGIGDVPMFVTIRFPATWKVSRENSTLAKPLANPGILEYNSTVSKDTSITVYFEKPL